MNAIFSVLHFKSLEDMRGQKDPHFFFLFSLVLEKKNDWANRILCQADRDRHFDLFILNKRRVFEKFSMNLVLIGVHDLYSYFFEAMF